MARDLDHRAHVGVRHRLLEPAGPQRRDAVTASATLKRQWPSMRMSTVGPTASRTAAQMS